MSGRPTGSAPCGSWEAIVHALVATGVNAGGRLVISHAHCGLVGAA
ncbi:hypothetical protein ACU635_35385 [[Actinomadura] parvosata]